LRNSFTAAFTISPRFKIIETAGFEPAKSLRTAIAYVVPRAFVTRFLRASGGDKDFGETYALCRLSYAAFARGRIRTDNLVIWNDVVPPAFAAGL
jgi:hypothetical protein